VAQDILITDKSKFYGAKELDKYPGLKIFACPATQIDHIDMDEVYRRGIELVDIAGEPGLRKITSTAEHALGLVLALVRDTVQAHNHVMDGKWDRNAFQGRELSEMICCVLGLGRLGRIFWDISHRIFGGVVTDDPTGVDVVAVFVDRNPTSIDLVDEAFINKMNKGSYLVNVSATGIIHEPSVIAALDSGQLAGYATDIPDHAPSTEERPSKRLIEAANKHRVIISPHIGGNTVDGRNKADKILAKKLGLSRGAYSKLRAQTT